jgi:hypothetical protein
VDLNAKAERKDQLGMRTYMTSNDNWVKVVKFTIYKNLIVKSIMFPHHNIQKEPGPLLTGRYNQTYHILIKGRSILDVQTPGGADYDTDLRLLM